MGGLLLVRHGETAWNREGRMQGWSPTPLTDRGRKQARALGAHLADRGVDRVVASDLRRATETAREVVRATGAPLSLDRGWRERSFGVYEGLPADEWFDTHPQFSVFETGYAAALETPENGESMVDVRERVLAALDRAVADLDGEETVAVVTHGGPVMSVVGKLRGIDVLEAIETVRVDNCSLTEVAVGPDGEPALGAVGEVVAAVDA